MTCVEVRTAVVQVLSCETFNSALPKAKLKPLFVHRRASKSANLSYALAPASSIEPLAFFYQRGEGSLIIAPYKISGEGLAQ